MSPRRNWDNTKPSIASECAPPPGTGGAHSPEGEGLGESQFRRLEKKLSALPTLCCNPLSVPISFIHSCTPTPNIPRSPAKISWRHTGPDTDIQGTFLFSTRSLSLVSSLAWIIVYLEYQSVCLFVGIGSPHPFPRKRVCLPPRTYGGGDNTRWRVREWGDPMRTTGQKADTLYSLCSLVTFLKSFVFEIYPHKDICKKWMKNNTVINLECLIQQDVI